MDKAEIITNGNTNLKPIKVNSAFKAIKAIKDFIEWATIDYLIEGCDEFYNIETKEVLNFKQAYELYEKNKEL